jgi:Zn finger protein HypA/HybF involved in hydrogenase expression
MDLWRRRLRKSRIVGAFTMDLAEVTCPTCFEVFEVAVPHQDEMPAEVDYDCEVCCRPMVIVFTGDEVYARGLGD